MAEKTITPHEEKPAVREETRSLDQYVRPAVDILESEDGMTIIADLPGVTKERLAISIENGILTIEGTCGVSPEGREVYREFILPNFYRQFQLSDVIDQRKTRAELSNGVLTLHLAKAEAAKPRKIAIQTA